MFMETLINDSIVASLTVDCSGQDESPGAKRSEFALISASLRAICDPRQDHLFVIFGRAHKIVRSRTADSSGTVWRPWRDGGGEAKIVLALVDQPAKRVYLKYKLVRPAGEGSSRGWLTVEFSPTTILAGNNVHPATIADAETGEMYPFPSSAPKVMQQVFRLSFDLLEELHRQVTNSNRPLFHQDTQDAIRRGEFHLVRAQWCAYLPTPDVSRFLQLLGVLFGHTIAKGRGLIHIADHLGFDFDPFPNRQTYELNGVMLRKLHGTKNLFSLVFYDKRKRVADMKQGKSLLPAEVATIRENVRFDITAHSLGIVAIVKKARRRLEAMLERGFPFGGDWTDDFLNGEIAPSAWWLERAILVLSLRLKEGAMVRKSFAEWLVPYMIDRVLRLKVIAGLSRDNFHRLVALDDPVAVAWRADEPAKRGAWAARLVRKAACAQATVYSRREKWLLEFGIDIAVPHALYRDLLFLGPSSLTRPEDRSASLEAVWHRNGADAIRLHEKAARNLERQLAEIVRPTINSRLHAMEVKVARKTVAAPRRVDAAIGSRAAISANASAVRPAARRSPTISAPALAAVQRPRLVRLESSEDHRTRDLATANLSLAAASRGKSSPV